jgi:hypothetical protein
LVIPKQEFMGSESEDVVEPSELQTSGIRLIRWKSQKGKDMELADFITD